MALAGTNITGKADKLVITQFDQSRFKSNFVSRITSLLS